MELISYVFLSTAAMAVTAGIYEGYLGGDFKKIKEERYQKKKSDLEDYVKELKGSIS